MILNKMKRVIRQRLLTREEVESDRKVREQIARDLPRLTMRHLFRFEPLQTHADLRRDAKRFGRLRVVRFCPKAQQVVVETIGA